MKLFSKLLVLLSIGTFFACDDESSSSKSDVDATPSILISEGYSSKTKITIRAKEALHVGYNKLYIQVKDSATGKLVDDVHIHFQPMMEMMTMSHSAPTESVSQTTQDVKDYIAIGFYPIMASNSMEGWNLEFEIHRHDLDLEVPYTVKKTWIAADTLIKNFIASDNSAKTFVTLLNPVKPTKSGSYKFEIAVHYKKDMNTFPFDSTLTVEIDPRMPSMENHTSANNVNPVHLKNGHYFGDVNFSMTGDWKVNLVFKRNGVKVGETYFNYLF